MNKFLVTVLISHLCLGEINGYAKLDWEPNYPAFEQSFYEDVLNPEQCKDQLNILSNNQVLAMQYSRGYALQLNCHYLRVCYHDPKEGRQICLSLGVVNTRLTSLLVTMERAIASKYRAVGCRNRRVVVRPNGKVYFFTVLDAGLRLPRGITTGNLVDWGNFFQCIGIDDNSTGTRIEGKYYRIKVPANQDLKFPQLPGLPDRPDWLPEIPGLPEWIRPDLDPRELTVDEEIVKQIKEYNKIEVVTDTLAGKSRKPRSLEGTGLENIDFTLAVCVPKPCTTQEWFNGLLFNLTAIGFEYEDSTIRMKGDKPWVPADYIAVVIFSLIGCITLISTGYDICQIYYRKADPKNINPLYRSFSVYTNYQRLTTFTKVPGAIECLDGIRAIAMIWVIVGHTFTTLPPRINVLDSVNWTISFASTWITAAPLSVDTFFLISGMLLVYTTAGKLTGKRLIKSLHVFYLNRLFRMFPLLAAAVLIQASFMHRIADGPYWDQVAVNTENCRIYWWSTLLYVQNFVNGLSMCLPHSWYLAIDIQLHIISPIILFWVLSGNRKGPWIALSAGLLAVLTGATVYNFLMEFNGAVIQPARLDKHSQYMLYYYLNTLARASPFFVGMIFGYLLHLWKGKQLMLSKMATCLLWVCAFFLTSVAIYASHPMKDIEWDNQTIDSLVNSFSRPIWAAGVGWMVFACQQGYGGPINWLLSHSIWKMTSRLSYGMYIFHYPMMYVTSGTVVSPIHFTELKSLHRFLSEFSLAFLVSFAMTLIVDSPFSIILKQIMLGGGPKRPIEKQKEVNDNIRRAMPPTDSEKYSVKL